MSEWIAWHGEADTTLMAKNKNEKRQNVHSVKYCKVIQCGCGNSENALHKLAKDHNCAVEQTLDYERDDGWKMDIWYQKTLEE